MYFDLLCQKLTFGRYQQRTHWCKGAYTYYHYNQQSFDPEIIGMLLASMFGILVYQAFIEKRQVARWMLGLFVCGGAAFLGFVVPAELRCKGITYKILYFALCTYNQWQKRRAHSTSFPQILPFRLAMLLC